MSSQHRNILLVEDHQADVDLTKKAMATIPHSRTIHVAIDGVEALAFLRKQGRFADSPMPDLVLLDLNMPRKDGWAVLSEMRADPKLDTLPVVILTTSASPSDVQKAFHLGANAYVVKPISFTNFTRVIRAIDEFWFGVSVLPGR